MQRLFYFQGQKFKMQVLVEDYSNYSEKCRFHVIFDRDYFFYEKITKCRFGFNSIVNM